MNGYLLDTDVVSMLAPERLDTSDSFQAWLHKVDAEGKIFLTVVTIHELEKGISLLELKGASAKAASLRSWISGLLAAYADKVLPFESPAATIAGRLEAKAMAAGHAPGMADAAIAGIAGLHGLAVVTRNGRHFAPFGIDVISPDGPLPD